MEIDNLDSIFKDVDGQFDLDEPNTGHEARFLQKIVMQSATRKERKSKYVWNSFLAIAATLVISFSIFSGLNSTEKTGLASVSPEMSEAQDIFTATINEELKKLEKERSPLTENIVYEAERQLKALEEDYAILNNDLRQSGNDKRVIYAMISNFQSRIDILKNILDKIEDLKNKKYETDYTL